MATAISASFACTFVQKRSTTVPSSCVIGLPAMVTKRRFTCSLDDNNNAKEKKNSTNTGMSASILAASYGATMNCPAVALVDERMSTEGTGLPFGLSNNLLGWILLGIFGLIWTFYIVYTSSLDEDDDSGLSL